MKLSKSQTICSSLLAAALCALAVDQLAGSSPPAARGAAATPAVTPPAPTLHQADESGLQPSVELAPRQTLAARLRAIQKPTDDLSQIRDAFKPPAEWIGNTGADHSLPLERALKFQQSHQLKAIVESGGQEQALVDDTLLHIGQSIDGFRLSSVSTLNALFTDGQVRVVLGLINNGPNAEKPPTPE